MELGVAVLLDDEGGRVLQQEGLHLLPEREGPDPHVVERDAALRQPVQGLPTGRVAPADRQQPPMVAPGIRAMTGAGTCAAAVACLRVRRSTTSVYGPASSV